MTSTLRLSLIGMLTVGLLPACPLYAQAGAANPVHMRNLQDNIRKKDAGENDFLSLATTLRQSGSHAEAVNVLRRAQAKFPGETEVLRQLGIALIVSGKPVDAVEVFDMLAAMEPDNAMAYNGKGVAFDTAGNHTAALEMYEKALSLDNSSTAIRNNMAMSMILSDELDDAVAMLETLYEEEPDIAKVRHNLALAYGLRGDRERAMEIGLQDLSEKQMQENLEFYQRYIAVKGLHHPVELMTQDGHPIDELFADAPDRDAPDSIMEASPSAGGSPDAEIPEVDE